jgi:hypothetical protein
MPVLLGAAHVANTTACELLAWAGLALVVARIGRTGDCRWGWPEAWSLASAAGAVAIDGWLQALPGRLRLATALTTAAALPVVLPVLPPADIAWTYKTNQTLGETIGRAGRGALPPAELGRPGPPVPAYVTWAAEEVSHGVLYALFAGGGSGAYAESAAPDPGSCPREYGGSSAGSGFFCVRAGARKVPGKG